jgi:16S rRNA (cytosine967-C5)-methyltransferase
MASRPPTVSPAREAAFEVLLRVFEDDAYADRALRAAATGLAGRDRALAQRLSYGAVQRRRTLDHAIERLGRRRVARLDAPVRAALRLGAYQLGFVDGVARYAAVNESVELVRRAGLERAVPFTNAVLRRIADGVGSLLAALNERTAAEAALKHSFPDWIAQTWWSELGASEARLLMRALNEPAPIVVRLACGDVDGTADTMIPGAWHVDRIDEQAFADGRISPQSAASQLAGLVVGSGEGDRTLDLCAAPGGKTSMLSGDVTAIELNAGRARELEENLRRAGSTNVRIVVADGRDLPEDLAGFDRALVDPPCSGLGVLNRRPDLRWRATPLPELQLALLRTAAERVRPGGTIVYSVCTINAEESEDVVDASGLAVDATLAREWPSFQHPRRPEFLQTLPHAHGTAGFFIARLRV